MLLDHGFYLACPSHWIGNCTYTNMESVIIKESNNGVPNLKVLKCHRISQETFSTSCKLRVRTQKAT